MQVYDGIFRYKASSTFWLWIRMSLTGELSYEYDYQFCKAVCVFDIHSISAVVVAAFLVKVKLEKKIHMPMYKYICFLKIDDGWSQFSMCSFLANFQGVLESLKIFPRSHSPCLTLYNKLTKLWTCRGARAWLVQTWEQTTTTKLWGTICFKHSWSFSLFHIKFLKKIRDIRKN